MLKLSFVLYELAWMAVFALVIHHAVTRWGRAKTAAFFVPAIFFGFLLEWATQEVFTRYHYGEGFLVYVFNVPLNISLAWAALLYFGYGLAKEKVGQAHPLKAAAVAGVALVAIDLLVFEPLAKTFGYWVWTPPGGWFDSPVGNVYGWFWVVVLYLGAFQWIEQKKWDWKKKLAAGLLAIAPLTLALTALLKIYEAVLGKL